MLSLPRRHTTKIISHATRWKLSLKSMQEEFLSKANGLGKDFPNQFMAGSLPKTIKQSNDPPLSRGYTLRSGEGQFGTYGIDGNKDAEGISSLSNEEIFEQLAHMGYVTNFESLTFFKGHFSPQWKFFIHTILHCLSSKKTAYDQFSSNIATTIICLAISRRFNFSKFIFEAMVKNLDSPHKLLLYPRFIQLLLNKQQRLLLPYTRTYPTPTLTSKLFSNMRRTSKGYSGVVTPLFEKETSSMPHDLPIHAVHSHGSTEGSMQQPDLMVLVNKLNNKVDGLEKDLQHIKKIYSTALTKLVLRVKKLEYKLKSGKARRKAKIVLSDDEEIAEDSSKQGRRSAISVSNLDRRYPQLLSFSTQQIHPSQSVCILDSIVSRKKQPPLLYESKVHTEASQSKGIDWNDLRSEVEKGSSKPSKRETSKTVEEEKVEKEDVKPDPVMSEKKAVGTRRKTLARRRASDKQVEDNSKRQKKEKELMI
ncbi:hypothetical protein Tco_0442260 [Tanacetum coccineum]